MKTKNIKPEKLFYDIHSEHNVWRNKLSFFSDELKIFQNRLSEIILKNTSKEVLAMVEHFQNQIILNQEKIDLLKHDIKIHEQYLEDAARLNPIDIDKRKFPDHSKEMDNLVTFEKGFNELRKDLTSFAARHW